MAQMQKTRRLAGQGKGERASELMLVSVTKEDITSAADIQMAWLKARYPIGEAHARVIAEHAFSGGRSDERSGPSRSSGVGSPGPG